MEIITEVRKVGNSAAVIIPKNALEKEGIKLKDKVKIILLPKKTLGQALWGGKKFKGSTAKLMRGLKQLRWD